MSFLTKRRALRAVIPSLLTGALVVTTAGTSQALVADRPTDRFPGFNGAIEAIVHKGDRIYVAGEFTQVTGPGGTVRRNHAAAVDAATGRVLRWNPNVNGPVYGLGVKREGVYLAGNFSQVKGKSRTDIARVSLRTGRPHRGFTHRTNGRVNAVTFSKGSVHFGGAFTEVNGKFRNNLASVSRGSSSKLRRWSPDARGGQVFDLVRRKGAIYVGGAFRSLNGSSAREYLGRVSTRTGGLSRSFSPNPRTLVRDVEVTRTRVYAALGGRGGGGALSVQRGDGDRVFYRRFDGDVEAIKTMKRQVYVGGHFDNVCATSAQSQANGRCLDPGAITRHKGASLSGKGRVTGWNPNLNSPRGVTSLDTYKSKDRLVAGGHFTRAGAVEVPHFAVFD